MSISGEFLFENQVVTEFILKTNHHAASNWGRHQCANLKFWNILCSESVFHFHVFIFHLSFQYFLIIPYFSCCIDTLLQFFFLLCCYYSTFDIYYKDFFSVHKSECWILIITKISAEPPQRLRGAPGIYGANFEKRCSRIMPRHP